MIANSQILLISQDPQLARELDDALPAEGTRPTIHEVREHRQAADAIRNRRPWIIVTEMSSDLRPLKVLSDELRAESPESLLVAAFRPDTLGRDMTESTLLIEAIRMGVRDFIRRPMSRNDVGELLSRLGEQPGRHTERVGRIISMVSNKGGVGKSTLAVNAAAGLAMQYPDRVLLVDVSLQMGVCSSMLDLQPTTTLSDAYRQLDRLDELLLRQLTTQHPSGLHLLAAPDKAVDGIKIDDDTISRVLTLARRAYDFVIVDTFPMLDRVMMSVLDLSDMSYLVIENVVPTVISGAKLIELLDSMGLDPAQQRVVLNRYARRPGSLRPMDVAQRLKRDIDHILPFHNRVVQAANTGRPFVLDVTRFSSLGRRTRNFVRGIEQLAQQPVALPTIDRAPLALSNGTRHDQ